MVNKKLVKLWSKYKGLVALVVLVVLLYTLTDGIITFYRGYHNLDLAFNFLNLGYSHDINLDGNLVSLADFYIHGRKQMINGFGWVCFDVVIGSVLGWLVRK